MRFLQRTFCFMLLLSFFFSCSTPSVLSRIEKYDAPAYPKDEWVDKETYDYRVENKYSVPPSFTDCMAVDLWQRCTMDLGCEKMKPQDVTLKKIEEAIDIYMIRDWSNIAGYRPWTHWNFIRGLSKKERSALASEVHVYIIANGIKDPEWSPAK